MLSDLGNFSEDEAYHISKIISEPTAIVYDVKRSCSLNTEIRMKRELQVKQTVLQKSTIKLSRAAACNTKFDSKWCSKYSVKASSSQTNFLSVFFSLGNLVEFVRVKLI
jgi:hypothetical protein